VAGRQGRRLLLGRCLPFDFNFFKLNFSNLTHLHLASYPYRCFPSKKGFTARSQLFGHLLGPFGRNHVFRLCTCPYFSHSSQSLMFNFEFNVNTISYPVSCRRDTKHTLSNTTPFATSWRVRQSQPPLPTFSSLTYLKKNKIRERISFFFKFPLMTASQQVLAPLPAFYSLMYLKKNKIRERISFFFKFPLPTMSWPTPTPRPSANDIPAIVPVPAINWPCPWSPRRYYCEDC
jgi:hypothetical protein